MKAHELTFDDYGFDEGARCALRGRLAGYFGMLAGLGEALAAIVTRIERASIPDGVSLERLMTRERALAAEVRADAAHLAKLILDTLEVRGERSRVREEYRELLGTRLRMYSEYQLGDFAKIAVSEDARDMRDLTDIGRVAEQLAFGGTPHAEPVLYRDVLRDDGAARALAIADTYRFASPKGDVERMHALRRRYFTGTMTGAPAVELREDGVQVDLSSYLEDSEPSMFMLMPRDGGSSDEGAAITLVPATRLWDALRDVWEVDVDLSEEVAWLLSAEPLVCRADTVVVPAAKLDAAGIARDGGSFTIIGVADRFELWPTEAWQRDCEGFDLEGLFGSRSR